MKKITIICFLIFVNSIYGQEFNQHQWKNRVVVILTNNIKSEVFKQQLQAFHKPTKEFKERKIVSYVLLPANYQLGHPSKNWIINQEIFNEFKKTDKEFEVILIGLDGDVKLRETEFLSTERLFTIIDTMPMRKREIRNKN